MYSGCHTASLNAVGFPIRTSPGQRSVGISPEHFAATHVLHRLLAPRHPPYALSSLQTSISLTRNCVDRGLRPPLFAADLDLRTFVISAVQQLKLMCFFNFPFVCTFQRTVPNLCGADRDRTDDPRLAKPVLSQLSYSPKEA